MSNVKPYQAISADLPPSLVNLGWEFPAQNIIADGTSNPGNGGGSAALATQNPAGNESGAQVSSLLLCWQDPHCGNDG